jgi:hypothetical protein
MAINTMNPNNPFPEKPNKEDIDMLEGVENFKYYSSDGFFPLTREAGIYKSNWSTEEKFYHLYKKHPNIISIECPIDINKIAKFFAKYGFSYAGTFSKTSCYAIIPIHGRPIEELEISGLHNLMLSISSCTEFEENTIELAGSCSPESLKKVLEIIAKSLVREKDNSKIYISFLKKTFNGLSTKSVQIDRRAVDISINYGSKFKEVHERVQKHICDNKPGLFWFYGPPGTGKSSYIYHLVESNSHLKFLYIPNDLIGDLAGPELMEVLEDINVVIFEDAENALIDRADNSRPSLVANILNITDGAFGAHLKIKVILTSNVAIDVDKALLRKGRMLACHEFGKLTPQDAEVVAKSLNKKIVHFDKDVSLAEIYNDESNGSEVREEVKAKEKKSIGFGLTK